jgi:hypothetical protein
MECLELSNALTFCTVEALQSRLEQICCARVISGLAAARATVCYVGLHSSCVRCGLAVQAGTYCAVSRTSHIQAISVPL